MIIHDEPDDVEHRTSIELQTRKITMEQLHRFEMPRNFFLHLVWI